MTLAVLDRLFETTTTTGNGDITLLGAVQGFKAFSTAGNGAKILYQINDGESNGVVQNWEIGIGTINTGSNILQRTTVLSSSNSNAPVTFGSGTKNVLGTIAAKAIIVRDENLAFTEGFGTGGGTANAQTVQFPVAPLAYSDGMDICYFATVANTASMTINVNGLGAKTVKYKGSDIAAGTVQIGSLVWGKYRASTGFIELVSPTPISGSITASKTANYTATTSDTFVPCDATGGAFTITLPTPVGNTNFSITIEKTDSTYTPITITTPAGVIKPTKDNNASTTLNSQGEAVVLTSDGTNYIIRNRHIPSEWVAFTPASSQGLGTISNVSLYRRRVGDSLEIRGRWQNGTVSSAEIRMGFTASGETITSTSNISTIESAGGMALRNTGTVSYVTLIEPSVSYLTLGNSSGSAALSKLIGTNSNTNEIISIKAMIPIQGWNG